MGAPRRQTTAFFYVVRSYVLEMPLMPLNLLAFAHRIYRTCDEFPRGIPHLFAYLSPCSLRPPSPSPSEMSTLGPFKPSDIVRLNVGGQRFDTTLRTLLIDKSSDVFRHFVVLLDADLAPQKIPQRDSDGAFFLDRDPDHFRTLLNNFRFLVELQNKTRLRSGKSHESLSTLALEDTDSIDSKKPNGIFSKFRRS
ncbi:hypothetical protein QR680_017290 [Steinernema hermaphroditum]|uniref:Potassium channel tetramerisation-type BTB domain-containing protein n=1 Tax=Steinernema hermaphroditum TaxID=289476 RepID=A0AA39LP35_9BILA|nr:hypothetical protein QR680_017290 [Steinernema hermaphroditum]